jgi:general secretion pathway protein L
MSVGAGLRVEANARAEAAWRWWGGQLARLIPARLLSACSPLADRIVLSVEGLEITVFSVRGHRSEHEQLCSGDITAVAAFMRAKRHLGWLRPIYLRVPLMRCLVRQVPMPVVAMPRAEQILALNLERSTPFKRADVFSGFAVPAQAKGDTITLAHIVCKRRAVAPLIDALALSGLTVSGIEVIAADGATLRLRADGKPPAKPVVLRWLDRATMGLGAACLIGGLLSLGGLAWNQRQALARIDAEVVELQRTSTTLRDRQTAEDKALRDLISLRARKTDAAGGMISLLEDVARLLPDTAHLSELRVADGAVIIEGLARQAADLVGLFAASPRFAEVTFDAPVTRDPTRNLERFRIRMKLKPAGGRP